MPYRWNLIGVATVGYCVGLDIVLQCIGSALDLDWRVSQLIGWLLACTAFITLWWRPAVIENLGPRPPWWWLLTLALLGLSIRAAVQSIYFHSYEIEWLSIFGSAATLLLVMWIGLITTRPQDNAYSPADFLRRAALCVVGSMVVLRLLYAQLLELLPEESYYWKYAENLDFGYLDHPPMVGVLIALGQICVGINELGVRLIATLSWFIMAYFTVRLSNEWFESKTAPAILILLATLPFFTAIGLYMSPDTPLMACWAATLFFLHRAILRRQSWAWYAVGVCIGLGMLSKYPMALIAPAIGAFLLIDRDSRHWLFRIEPYCAAILSFLVFSPVLYWNALHEWASFTFQGPRRFEAAPEFSMHLFVAFFVLLLTPVGAWIAATFVLPKRWGDKFSLWNALAVNRRVRSFILVFGGVPLLVFLYASATQEVKVNWLGPPLLVLLPILAQSLTLRGSDASAPLLKAQRGWLTTIMVLVSSYALFLFYLGIGFPGVGYPKGFKKMMGWEALATEIMSLSNRVQSETNISPIVMGADSHYVASALGFYRAKEAHKRGLSLPPSTMGRHLLGGAYSLMYRYWSDIDFAKGRPVLMVSRTRTDVEDPAVAAFFDSLGEVIEIAVPPKGAKFFARVGYGYHSESSVSD